jgi:amidase
VIEAESIVAFNHANAGRAFRFGQDIFLAAEATRGDLSEAEYFSARRLPILDPHARARC